MEGKKGERKESEHCVVYCHYWNLVIASGIYLAKTWGFDLT
jgi:hypothetical protein